MDAYNEFADRDGDLFELVQVVYEVGIEGDAHDVL